MMIVWLPSLTACASSGAGDFCDIYTVVDMPTAQAVRIDRVYQERILTNELYQIRHCPI